jgi:hypothetical protein
MQYIFTFDLWRPLEISKCDKLQDTSKMREKHSSVLAGLTDHNGFGAELHERAVKYSG